MLENPLMEVRIIMHYYINISQPFLFRLNPIYRIQREIFFLFFIRGFFVEKLGRRDIWNIKEKKGENIYNACFHHSRGPKTKTVHEEGANGTHAWFCLASISPFRSLGRRHTEPINLLKQAKLIDMLQHVGSFDSKFVYTISY